MADERRSEEERWSAYYQRVAGRPVAPFYLRALARFDQPVFAIDLGSGAGIETLDLLRRGWRVLAIDKQRTAIDNVKFNAETDGRPRLETRVAPFEGLTLPPSDLIWAELSLPFCPHEHFDALWSQIVGSLRPGGRFAGDLFGVRHAWSDKGGTFHTRELVEALTEPFHLEYLQEGEGETQTALDGIVHGHQFSLILRRD